MASRPLSPTERRLHERVRALLPPGEDLRAAIVVSIGSRPGAEGLAAMAGIVGMLLMRGRRRYFTLAVTDRGVVRFRNRSLRKPAEILDRHELRDLQAMTGKWGEQSVQLAGHDYGIEGIWGNELAKIGRLRTRDQ